jgi:hypothetical protein
MKYLVRFFLFVIALFDLLKDKIVLISFSLLDSIEYLPSASKKVPDLPQCSTIINTFLNRKNILDSSISGLKRNLFSQKEGDVFKLTSIQVKTSNLLFQVGGLFFWKPPVVAIALRSKCKRDVGILWPSDD